MESNSLIFTFGGIILLLYLVAVFLVRKLKTALHNDKKFVPSNAKYSSTIGVNHSMMFMVSSFIAIGLFGQYLYNKSQKPVAAAIIVEADTQKPTGPPVDLATATVLTDEVSLKAGAERFKNLCASCHGQLGEGIVGPNFADNFWIHGGDFTAVCKTIAEGVPAKGMIAWSAQLSGSEIKEVASYILSLEGTNPPNAKAAQGDKYERKEVIPFAIRPTSTTPTVKIPNIPLKGNAKHGELLFNAILGCAHCHGTGSVGHVDNRNLRAINKRYNKDGLKVYDTVMEIGRLGTAMPPWGHLTLEEKKDIKTFIFSVQEK
jgi:mono/diheme cytochrome c family protein